MARLDEDTLLLCFSFAGSGAGGHRTACSIAAVSVAFRALVQQRLWRLLCEDLARDMLPHLTGTLECPLFGAPTFLVHPWERSLHRDLAVPIRYRWRTHRSWRLAGERRGLQQHGLRLDTSAKLELTPGYGFGRWRRADTLLNDRARELLVRVDGMAPGTPPAASPPAPLFCVLRESSPQHLLLAGVMPRLPNAARQELEEMPFGELFRASCFSLQRCVCCAKHLRSSARGSRSVRVPVPARALPPTAQPPPRMRDATRWFLHEHARWTEESGIGNERATTIGDDDDSSRGVHHASLETALVCPHGHVVLTYQLSEPLSTEDESEFDEFDDDDDDDDDDEEEEEEEGEESFDDDDDNHSVAFYFSESDGWEHGSGWETVSESESWTSSGPESRPSRRQQRPSSAQHSDAHSAHFVY
jgi:hypothetical protein